MTTKTTPEIRDGFTSDDGTVLTWLVRIGDDVLEMDHNAPRPNGINTFLGTVDELGNAWSSAPLSPAADVPVGVWKGIKLRLDEGIFGRD